MTPLLTVAIPVYNEERYLARTIESALGQSFRDFELVISDNCSTDASHEIARRYAARDSRVRIVRHDRNVGATINFKSCLDAASTKYFVWLGAHDVFASEYLAAAVGYLEHNEGYVMAYPSADFIDADDQLVAGDISGDIDTTGMSRTRRLLMIASRLSNCTSIHGVFRTEALKRTPFKHVFGSDMLIIFAAASLGHIKFLDGGGISRRMTRRETPEQAMARWESMGLFSADRGRLGVFTEMTLEHVRFVQKSAHLSCAEKCMLTAGVPVIHARRFGRAILWELLLWACGFERPGEQIRRLRRLSGRR